MPSEGVFAYFYLDLKSALRKSGKEFVIEPANVMCILIVTSILTVILSPISRILTFFEVWVFTLYVFFVCCLMAFINAVIMSLLTPKKRKIVVLTPHAVFRMERARKSEIEWARVLFVLNWAGDLFLCTFAGSTCIPRDAFASPEEAREFIQIARELHKTRGAGWRADWNGKTFGKPPENDPGNLPK